MHIKKWLHGCETMWWAGSSPQCSCASRTEDTNGGSSRTQQRWSQWQGRRAGTQEENPRSWRDLQGSGGDLEEEAVLPTSGKVRSISGTVQHECGCWEAKAPTTAVEKGVWPKGVQRGDARCENHSAAGEDCLPGKQAPNSSLNNCRVSYTGGFWKVLIRVWSALAKLHPLLPQE